MNFAFVSAFVLASFQNAKPDVKTKPPDETAKRIMKNTIAGGKKKEEKQKLNKNVDAAAGKTR